MLHRAPLLQLQMAAPAQLAGTLMTPESAVGRAQSRGLAQRQQLAAAEPSDMVVMTDWYA